MLLATGVITCFLRVSEYTAHIGEESGLLGCEHCSVGRVIPDVSKECSCFTLRVEQCRNTRSVFQVGKEVTGLGKWYGVVGVVTRQRNGASINRVSTTGRSKICFSSGAIRMVLGLTQNRSQ